MSIAPTLTALWLLLLHHPSPVCAMRRLRPTLPKSTTRAPSKPSSEGLRPKLDTLTPTTPVVDHTRPETQSYPWSYLADFQRLLSAHPKV